MKTLRPPHPHRQGTPSQFPLLSAPPLGCCDSPPSSQDSQTIPPSLSSSTPVRALSREPGSVLSTKLLLLVWTHQHSSLETEFQNLHSDPHVTICFTLRITAAPCLSLTPSLFLPGPEESLQAPSQYPPRGPAPARAISGFISLTQDTSWLPSPVDLLVLSLLPETFPG